MDLLLVLGYRGGKMGNPNAWLLLGSRFGELLDAVYRRNSGEIWLFNNDLYILEHRELFNEIYIGMLDREPLRTHIRSVKMLLTADRLERVKDTTGPAYANLCSLSGHRLRTFYIGSLEHLEPPFPDVQGALGDNPWIFYTVEGSLVTRAAEEGIVLVRHAEYPFSVRSNPNEPQLAVGWRVRDQSGETAQIQSRIERAFDSWFTRLTNFQSIEPELREGRVTGFTFRSARQDYEIDETLSKMAKTVRRGGRPRVAQVDFGVVTALEDEAAEVEEKLTECWTESRGGHFYRVGYYRTGEGELFWIAVCRHTRMGSVAAALATQALIRDYSPRYVVLLGIAGGRKPLNTGTAGRDSNTAPSEVPTLDRGDVVYASAISPYEYEKIEVIERPDGESQQNVLREDRTMDCSTFLFQMGERVQKKWRTRPPQIAQRPGSSTRTFPSVFGGVVASGCKVLADEEALRRLDADKPYNRKLIAIEMEGEGVAEAARLSNREFILIKGISDLADKDKNDEWRQYAARVATQFFIDMLEALPHDRGEL